MNERHVRPVTDHGIDSLRQLIDSSSIGTPGARALRDRAEREGESREVPTSRHCTVAVVDVVRFGHLSQTDDDRKRIRQWLYRALEDAFANAGIPWLMCRTEDRGDGVRVLAPAEVCTSVIADRLSGTLTGALHAHNRRHPGEAQIRLRVTLNGREVVLGPAWIDDEVIPAPRLEPG